ncbi:MAG: hypothetical protein ACR2NL_02300, partial [Acidimicrobiia bacterium]
IFGLIIVLLRTVDTSSRVLVETRRASAANTFATELLERAQALEWEHIGLAASTNGTSCATEQVGCTTYVAEFPEVVSDGLGGYTYDGEPMVFTNSDTYKPFLSFHELVERDGTEFDRYIFVSSVDDDGDGDEDFRRVTAAVTWPAAPGFQDKVTHSALISPYTRPSQPLIRTDVTYSAGTIDISGFSEGGALAPSTGWADTTPTAREQFLMSIALPAVETSALSDFVAEGRSRITSSQLALLRWAGVDGLISTADDTTTTIDSVEQAVYADDDVFTTPISSVGPTISTLSALAHSASFPYDINYRETTIGAGFLGSTENAAVIGYAAAEQTGTGSDGLPYAQSKYTGVGLSILGFNEYGRTGIDAYYAALGETLDPDGYRFVLYRRGDAADKRLTVTLTADRKATSGNQTTSGSLEYSSPELVLLNDDVIPAEESAFAGWVKVDLPSVDMALFNVEAGEGATNLFLPTAGDVVVSVFDPGTGAYTEAARVDYSAFGSDCSSVLSPTVVTLGGGSPLTISVDEDDTPLLDYTVSGTVTINPWCSSTTTDGSKITESVWQSVGPMVSATIEYNVVDVSPVAVEAAASPATLYDLTLSVTSDTFQITSIYDEPDV